MSDETPPTEATSPPAEPPPAADAVPTPRGESDSAPEVPLPPPTAQSLPPAPPPTAPEPTAPPIAPGPPAPPTPAPAPAPAPAPDPDQPATGSASPNQPGPDRPSTDQTEQAPTGQTEQTSTDQTEQAPTGQTEQTSTDQTEQASTSSPAGSKGSRRWVTAVVFAVIVVLLLGAIGYVLYQRFYGDPTRNAVAGDCLADLPVDVGETPVTVNSARVVACTDPAAVFRIEGRLDRVSEEQAGNGEICQAYEDARYMHSVVPSGRTGYVLCLSRVE